MKRLIVGLAMLLVLTQSASAARTSAHVAAESPEYGRKLGGMIGRGAINLSTCFVDLLVNVVNETRGGPPFVGTLVGVGKGAGCTVLRALSGGVDLITFWVPGFNGFPVSDSYENCLTVSSEPAQAQPAAETPSPAVAEPMEARREPPVVPPVSPSPQHEEKPSYTK